MYHSITFGDKNTWDDWHLIPSSRPVFNPPDVKTMYVEIPGLDGHIDLTEYQAGRILYQNRTGSLEFIVANDYTSWELLYTEIMNYLHGQHMKAVLEDDPAHYYEGRFSVNQWKSDKYYSLITIDYNVYPYKRKVTSTVDDWLWDPFSFETGIITYFKDLTVNGTLEVRIYGYRELVVPEIISSSDMTVQFEGEAYQIKTGSNIIEEIVIEPGEQLLTFIGNGTVTINYRGGEL